MTYLLLTYRVAKKIKARTASSEMIVSQVELLKDLFGVPAGEICRAMSTCVYVTPFKPCEL